MSLLKKLLPLILVVMLAATVLLGRTWLFWVEDRRLRNEWDGFRERARQDNIRTGEEARILREKYDWDESGLVSEEEIARGPRQ